MLAAAAEVQQEPHRPDQETRPATASSLACTAGMAVILR